MLLCSARPTAGKVGRNSRVCAATAPATLAARAGACSAHHHSRSQRSQPDLHCDFRCGRVSFRRCRPDVEADQPRPAFAIHPRPECRGWPLRSPCRDAFVTPRCAFHAEALGRDAQRQCRRILGRGQRELADDFGFVIDVHAHEPETIYVVPSRATANTFRPMANCAFTAALRRKRVGGADQRLAAKRLLRQRAARRDGGRLARFLWRVFRHHRWQVYASSDAGDNWAPIVRDLPAVLSVEVQTLP